MCGIAGIVSRDPELHDLELMLTMLAHRGPDGFGAYLDSEAALGSARLAIVDLVGGDQPISHEEEHAVLVFNGEVYNYPELRESLIALGHRFRTKSDAEVILHCYLEYGDSFASYLNGQFAIAIWDRRDHRLILVRDRFGVRPLYYFRENHFLIFASEIKSLLTHNRVPRVFNARALDQLFTFWTPIGNQTFFENIFELLPGHILIFEKGKDPLSKSYWQWPFPSLMARQKLSFDQAKNKFVQMLDRSVSLRLRSDVEVGAYLSGGIDSSSIVSFVARRMGDRLKTFSVEFDDESYDERSAQKLVSDQFRTQHKSIVCRDQDIESNFDPVIWHTEAPIFRTAPTPLYQLSDWVHRHGIKVVLTGEGADEMLLGYDIFRELKIRRFWSRQPESAWRPLLLKKLYAYLPHFQNPRFANLAIAPFKTHLTQQSIFYSHLVRWGSQSLNKIYFSEETQNRLHGYDGIRDFAGLLPKDYFEADPVDQAQFLELTTLLKGYLLSSQGDRMSMAHSVESRYPFLDHEFIQFVNSLPARFKLNVLKDKWILRESMKTILPEAITNRPKFAYQAPEVRPFIKMDGTLSSNLAHHLSAGAIKAAGIYDFELVESLLSKMRRSDLRRLGMRDNSAFVQILSTQIFYAHYFQKNIRNIAEDRLKSNPVRFRVNMNKKMIGAAYVEG